VKKKLTLVPLLIFCAGHVAAQEPCADGTLFEPYSARCAPVNDVRDQFIPPHPAPASKSATVVPNLDEIRRANGGTHDVAKPYDDKYDDAPEPGAIVAGIRYRDFAFPTTTSARLHTKMFVYPNGVQPQGFLDWLFTPATNNSNKAVEVVGVYRTAQGDRGVIGVFGRPCSDAWPCPDGDTSNGWQFFRDFFDLGCNITHIVDDGGHAQKVMHYANHTDRIDDGSPPLWRSAVYFWNYCDDGWDLVWRHDYRQDKDPNSNSAWWGPGYEIFGSEMYPAILELGYEDSLLYHDGVWSELSPSETRFLDPGDRPELTPWQLFHLQPNRSFGAGSVVNDNDAPEIRSQIPISIEEDASLEITLDTLEVVDPDVDPAYHFAPAISAFNGENYSREGMQIVPDENYFGTLTVPVSVSDGAAESAVFDLSVEVAAVNDAPVIVTQNNVSTPERTAVELTLADIVIDDPDNDLSELSLSISDGPDYQRQGNTITPLPGVVGNIQIALSVSDAEASSEAFSLTVVVVADTVPPVITISGTSTVNILVGDSYNDAGATATDDVDGDVSGQIVTDNTVDTSRAGTYSVVYSASDIAGNLNSVTRTVVVSARPAPPPVRKSGGGSFGYQLLILLLSMVFIRRRG
jgi:hypothetical protein